MEQKEKESDNIELRSEKVRNVIGKVPPRLVSLDGGNLGIPPLYCWFSNLRP